MEIVQIIISTIISTGIIAAFISHQYDKKIKAHQLELDRYMALIDELSKMKNGSLTSEIYNIHTMVYHRNNIFRVEIQNL